MFAIFNKPIAQCFGEFDVTRQTIYNILAACEAS